MLADMLELTGSRASEKWVIAGGESAIFPTRTLPSRNRSSSLMRQRDRRVAVLAPETREPSTLEPLRVHAQPGAVPLQHLGADAIPADEDEDFAAEWIARRSCVTSADRPSKPLRMSVGRP